MRKQKPRSSESRSLNDEIDALEQEIANASTSASKVGLKKRLAQKKAILIRQERKEGQARREAERAAEAERIRKKKMQELQMSNEDVHRMHDVRNQPHSPLSQAISDFQTKSNSGIYESHSPHHDSKNFMPHIRHSNIFNLHHINNHRCILDSSIFSNKITTSQQMMYIQDNMINSKITINHLNPHRSLIQSMVTAMGPISQEKLMQIIGAPATGEIQIDLTHQPGHKGSRICTICQRLYVEQRKVLRSGVLPECVCDNDLCVPIRRVTLSPNIFVHQINLL